MEKYKFVFIVLVYRNTDDLIVFFENFKLSDSKVIVVNSFYDKKSEEKFKQAALSNNADFFTVENKGYGAGNNAGINWALENYVFEYLVISNADIKILQMSLDDICPSVVNAPEIQNKVGHFCNPMQPYDIQIFEKIKYESFKRQNFYWAVLFCIGINNLLRRIYRRLHKNGGSIYMCHGSFLIIPFEVIARLRSLYNEEQFLFCEEDHLARLLKKNGVKTFFNPKISILHKEDGSVGSIKGKVNEITRNSYTTFYEYWH